MVPYIFFLAAMACSLFGFAATNIWSPPILINNGQNSTNGIGPLAIDSNSNAIIGWLPGSNPGTTDHIFFSTLTAGDSAWTLPEIIATVSPPFFPAYPVVDTTWNNNQTIFWGNINVSPLQLTISSIKKSKDSLDWSDPISIAIPNEVALGGDAKIDQKGNLLAVLPLTSSLAPPFSIQVFTLPAQGTAWTSPIEIGQDENLFPAIGVSLNNGRGVIAWKTDVPNYSLRALRYSFLTSSFSSLSFIPVPMGSTDILNIFINNTDSDQAMALFTSTDGSLQTVYFSQLGASDTDWSGSFLLSNSANNAQALSISSDGKGLYSVMWAEVDSLSNGYIYIANINQKGIIETVDRIVGPVAGVTSIDSGSMIAVDYYGNQVAIWSFTAYGNSIVQVASKAIKQSWSVPINLSTTGKAPFIVLSNQGTAVAIWIDAVSGNLFSSINSNIFDIASPAFFLGKLIKNHFLNSTQHVLKMTWKPLIEASITSYRIRENDRLIAEIPGSGPFEYDLYLTRKKMKQYTIQAVASNGNESIPLLLYTVK